MESTLADRPERLGGIAVLASYALAFAYSPAIRVGLWGGAPEALQPPYTVTMLLATAALHREVNQHWSPFSWLLVLSSHATRIRSSHRSRSRPPRRRSNKPTFSIQTPNSLAII